MIKVISPTKKITDHLMDFPDPKKKNSLTFTDQDKNGCFHPDFDHANPN